MRQWKRFLWCVCVCTAAVVAGAGIGGCGRNADRGDGTLRLVLDYLPNPIHAGIFHAQASGRFEAAGLDVTITAPTSTTDPLRLVAAGQADVGLAPIMDVLQAVADGRELVLHFALVDRPLAAVMVRTATGATRPRELEGKLVGLTGVPSDALTLEAMVRDDGGEPARVRTVTIGFNAAQALVAGTVDAAFGFWSYEGVIAGRSVELLEFRPGDHGIPNYPEIVAFSRREWAERNADRVAALRESIMASYFETRELPVAEALAGLLGVLEAETVEGLEPFWRALLPVLPGAGDFQGELQPNELESYVEWIGERGFLELDRPAGSLIFRGNSGT